MKVSLQFTVLGICISTIAILIFGFQIPTGVMDEHETGVLTQYGSYIEFTSSNGTVEKVDREKKESSDLLTVKYISKLKSEGWKVTHVYTRQFGSSSEYPYFLLEK